MILQSPGRSRWGEQNFRSAPGCCLTMFTCPVSHVKNWSYTAQPKGSEVSVGRSGARWSGRLTVIVVGKLLLDAVEVVQSI